MTSCFVLASKRQNGPVRIRTKQRSFAGRKILKAPQSLDAVVGVDSIECELANRCTQEPVLGASWWMTMLEPLTLFSTEIVKLSSVKIESSLRY